MGSNKIVPKVAREYIDRGCGVFPASAELLDQMEIAAGIEDTLWTLSCRRRTP
jgi:hypothetical protein